MAVSAAAYVGAAVIAASAAFIGVVIGKEQKTTEFRQDWINAQRSDLALVLALASNARGQSAKTKSEALVAFDEALNRIRLRENPEKEEWKSVLEALDRLRAAAYIYPSEVDLPPPITTAPSRSHKRYSRRSGTEYVPAKLGSRLPNGCFPQPCSSLGLR